MERATLALWEVGLGFGVARGQLKGTFYFIPPRSPLRTGGLPAIPAAPLSSRSVRGGIARNYPQPQKQARTK